MEKVLGRQTHHPTHQSGSKRHAKVTHLAWGAGDSRCTGGLGYKDLVTL